ncbi:hypothetical protein A2U01_0041232, partial [Trifolium medium]|nr:hypothetical protein [Trifolium medium]
YPLGTDQIVIPNRERERYAKMQDKKQNRQGEEAMEIRKKEEVEEEDERREGLEVGENTMGRVLNNNISFD